MKATDVDEIHLTGREREVLALLAQGRQLDEIAERLGIGTETVRTHLRKASARLGAANRTHAVAIAIRKKLI
jgi:DNA-binding CsgD family transcriptional regulator